MFKKEKNSGTVRKTWKILRFHIPFVTLQDKVIDSEEEIISVEGAASPPVPVSTMPDSNVKLIEEALQTLKAGRDGGPI